MMFIAMTFTAMAGDAVGEGQAVTQHEAPAVAEMITHQRAEHAELENVLHAHRIAAQPPRPTISGYQADLATVVVDWLTDILSRLLPQGSKVVRWLSRLGWPVLVVLVVLVVGIVVVQLFLRARRQPAAPTLAVLRRPALHDTGAGTDWGRTDWDRALQGRLAKGDVAGALEALWWWLADRLAPGRADPAWTSRELLEQAGRRDLRPQAQHLDRLLYGAEPVAVEAVRGVWQDLQESV